MATNNKKSKNSSKDSDKKSSRKAEESVTFDENKEDLSIDNSEHVLTPDLESNIHESQNEVPVEVEPVYEEPVLTLLIVESYEGGKEKGLFEGEGRAEFTGSHLYTGQFSAGMMHGQGCYKWADGLIYEGEFIRNHVTGKGVFKWPDGSCYEGEVEDGLRHGFGTYHSAGGQVSYSGEWFMGQRHGKGKMDYDIEGSSFYDGDWIENRKEGWGTRQYKSGNLYEGQWVDNVRHGEGTMRWMDKNQMYQGDWDHGIQHGNGQHIWFITRTHGSQYPQRNMYEGEFVKGLRQGFGIFFYANGARYEGEWIGNNKMGKGKFVFKNGRIYEGIFKDDHIDEYPDFEMDGMNTPDMTNIKTRTPLPSEHASTFSNDSRNTISPNFTFSIGSLLDGLDPDVKDENIKQVSYVILRHMTQLRSIYTFYSRLGFDENSDNTYLLTRQQMWLMFRDCQFHHLDMTLVDMDNYIAEIFEKPDEMHCPYDKILFREFLHYIVALAYRLYKEEHNHNSPVLCWCVSKLIEENLIKYACDIKGYIYREQRRLDNAIVHAEQAYTIYKAFLTPTKRNSEEYGMKMRQFLHILKDLKLLNDDLTAKAVINILAEGDPKVCDYDGAINMEMEMTFLEFFEALVGCAEVYVTAAVVQDPVTPHRSVPVTPAMHSVLSSHASQSRMASQAGSVDGINALESPHQPGLSEAGSPALRTTSAATPKTGDGSHKHDAHASNVTVTSQGGSEFGRHSSRITQNSGKKSDATGGEMKKSSSFISTQSMPSDVDGRLVQSVVSLAPTGDDGGSQGFEEEMGSDIGVADTEIDVATKQFNFWTHQLHIFFARKFFPAAQHFLALKEAVIQQLAVRASQAMASPSVEVVVEESSNAHPLESVAEENESALNGSQDNLQPMATSVTVES